MVKKDVKYTLAHCLSLRGPEAPIFGLQLLKNKHTSSTIEFEHLCSVNLFDFFNDLKCYKDTVALLYSAHP